MVKVDQNFLILFNLDVIVMLSRWVWLYDLLRI